MRGKDALHWIGQYPAFINNLGDEGLLDAYCELSNCFYPQVAELLQIPIISVDTVYFIWNDLSSSISNRGLLNTAIRRIRRARGFSSARRVIK